MTQFQEKNRAGRKRIDENGEPQSEKITMYFTPTLMKKVNAWCRMRNIKYVNYFRTLVEADIATHEEEIKTFLQLFEESEQNIPASNSSMQELSSRLYSNAEKLLQLLKSVADPDKVCRRKDILKLINLIEKGVFSKSDIQLCIVHLVRNSLKYVSWKYRKELARDLKEIYRAGTLEVDNADKQLVESVKPLLCEIRGTLFT